MQRNRFVMAAMVASSIAFMASGGSFNDPFDTISSDWQKDRFEPRTFEVEQFDGDNRLNMGVHADDYNGGSLNNPFYRFQGMKRDVTGGAGPSSALTCSSSPSGLEPTPDHDTHPCGCTA